MYFFIKRFFDIIGAICALILLLPIWIIISIAIKIDSKGPIYFRQCRLGKTGKKFTMYKFRSMVVDAEKKGAGLFNYKGDPRVTKVGSFLRKTSIDEFPQLINILLGQMSFIGPRPPVEYELGDFDTLNANYKKRFAVKPGMSGLAQVEGRNDLPWNEKIIYDNEYVDLVFSHKGLITDIKIFFKTIAKIFSKSDIYENKVSDDLDDDVSAKIAMEDVIAKAHEKNVAVEGTKDEGQQ